MGLGLGASFGAGGYADALEQQLRQREMERRTALLEEESKRRAALDQIEKDKLIRQTAIENVLMNEGTPAQDIPYGQGEGPGGGPELVNVEDPSMRLAAGIPAAPNIQTANRFRAVPIPGIAGSGGGMLRAKTLQEVSAAKQQAARDELLNKAYTVNPGAVVSSPLLGKLAEGGKKEVNTQAKEVLLDGKPRWASFDPDTSRFYVGDEDVTDRVSWDMSKAGGEGGRPYFTYQPVFDPAGVPLGAIKFDARGGPPQFVDVSKLTGGGQIKPPPGNTGQTIINSEAADAQLARLISMFNKGAREMVGPAEGRARSFFQRVPGVPVSVTGGTEWSDFEAATSAFRNAVIKAITGAQMSEPEAVRIRQQIPEVSDKPEVWLSKANQTRANLADINRRIQARQSGSAVAGPKIGDTKTFPGGAVGVWDGSAYVIQ